MQDFPGVSLLTDINQQELKGFSRSLAELHWLLLVLVLLYTQVPNLLQEHRMEVVAGMVAYAVFVVAFRFLNFYESETRLKLVVETWGMIMFATWVIWHTGGITSPLINLYLLVIVAGALTLGKLMTLIEVAAITVAYLYMGYHNLSESMFSITVFSMLMADFSPFYLVAYITTMLSADIHHSKGLSKRIAETDELTGLPNGRALKNQLERELKKAGRYSRSLSVVMVDSDELKKVNDKFGHGAGDELIKQLAHTLSRCIRGADVLARYGGDEFFIMMPETDTDAVADAAERLRRAVCASPLFIHGHSIQATISVGTATYPSDSGSGTGLLNRADEALYQSKRDGKNRVTSFDRLCTLRKVESALPERGHVAPDERVKVATG